MNHENYINRCLELARLGKGITAPNPMVGSVIVYNDSIIGEGYHQIYGGPHAEVNAINAVKDKSLLVMSTLYVNLEPCSHHGKTPPCADLIIEKGIKKVVIGARDPFPAVSGRGIEKLKQAGVEVIESVMEKECIDLNKFFYSFYGKNRPYIILKWAQTNDGYIAPSTQETRSSFKISNSEAQRMVHTWRSEVQAILVGKETILKDDPQLNVRLVEGKDPIPFILGSAKDIPQDYKIMRSHPVFFENNGETIDQIINYCLEHKIQSILVEGGAKTLSYFIDHHFWDEARIITNTELNLGDGIQGPVLNIPSTFEEQILPNNLLQIIYNQ